MRNALCAYAAVSSLIAAAGCTSGVVATETVDTTPSVKVAPATVTLDQGATQLFTTNVTAITNPAVTWTVQESGAGTVDSGGVYASPRKAGVFHVVATSTASPSISGTATVTVRDVAIAISPSPMNVAKSSPQQFVATVTGTEDFAVTWAVQEAGGGAVDANGMYTAPAALGTYHLIATSHADLSKTATVTISVVDATVAVNPPTASVTAGTSQAFTATVAGIADHTVTWSIQESAGGTVSGAGNYVAPIAAGTYHVVATSNAVPSASGSATVAVTGGFPAAPPLSNVTTTVNGGTVRVSFEPLEGAKDYRVYLMPALADISPQPDGTTAIRNGTYRCAGEREAPRVPTDNEPQVQSGAVNTFVSHDVNGYTRTLAEAILGHVYTAPGAGRTPVWAMGDPSHGADNLCFFQRWTETRRKKYVSSASERATLLATGWRDDGIAFYLPPGGNTTVFTSTANGARLYYSNAAEKAVRAGATAAFSVLNAPAAGTSPLYRVYYSGGCGGSHDELVVGKPRFDRAVHQGNTPIPKVQWSGLTGPTTLVVEALDSLCPFQGLLAPQHVNAAADPAYPAYLTLSEIRAADPLNEVFVNGQLSTTVRPRAIARSFVDVAPSPMPAMDFADDFVNASTTSPLTQLANPGFNSVRFDSPAYDVSFYTLQLPFHSIGTFLGELWVTFADFASDTNGKFRLTIKQKPNLAATTFLHVTGEMDLVSTDRRYPQILISDRSAPIQDQLINGQTLIVQSFGDWPPRLDVEYCDHRVWEVNDQCPRAYVDPISQNPFDPANPPLPPHAEVGDLGAVDARVRLDVYASTSRAYVFLEGIPYACVDLPAAKPMPAGPVTVTFGDVLYHSGVDVPDPPYKYHRAHLYTSTRRHFGALGFKGGVAAPDWDETRLPCVSM